MSRNNRELFINLVTFTVVIVSCTAYLAFGVYRWSPTTTYNTVTMQVGDTGLVLDGTGVFINGVRVGRVTNVEVNPDGALLSLEYPRSNKIARTTSVDIAMQSALGEPYINFLPDTGTGPYLDDGARIDTELVVQPESIPGIFNLITDLSWVVAADPMAKVLKTVSEAFDGTDQAMSAISEGSSLIAGVLLSRSTELRAMFANTQNYTGDFDWLIASLPEFSRGLGGVVDSYTTFLQDLEHAVVTTNLDATLTETIDPFLQRLYPYLRDILPNVRDAVGPLMPIATALDHTLPQVNVSDLLSRALQMFASKDAARLVVTVPPG